MAPPELSQEQRKAALEKAAHARKVRAEVKQLLKMGTITFPELLDRANEDDLIAGIKVGSVLESLPGTGKVKAKRIMEQHGIASNRRIRGLGARQRETLLELFG
ncbi:MAG: integration host factor, actinobacterial type [Acidimicrobiia bacterium]|nr:integration host factor, actinobacterial type [Acidimicrobiia bacterium]